MHLAIPRFVTFHDERGDNALTALSHHPAAEWHHLSHACCGTVTAGSEATADSVSLEVEARLTSRLARSRASLCLAKVVLLLLGVSKQSQRSPSCPRAGLTN